MKAGPQAVWKWVMRHAHGWLAPLRVRLLILVLLALLPVAALVIASGFSNRAKAVANAHQELLRVVHTVTLRQREHIDWTRDFLRKLADPRVLDPDAASRVRVGLSGILDFQKGYPDIGVADLEGRVRVNVDRNGGPGNLWDRPAYQSIVTNRENWKFVAHDYAVDRATGRALLYMAHPVTDPPRVLRGVVYAVQSLDWIYQFAPQAGLVESSTLTIISRDGNILLRYPDPDRRWRGQSLANMPDLEQLLRDQREGCGEGVGADGVRYVYGFTALSSTRGFPDAWAVAAIPASEVHADAHLVLIQNLTFLGFVGVLALSAAWFGGDVFVLQPLRRLGQATQRIRGGNFAERTELRHAPAELTGLARDFDAMARALALRIAEREHAEAELRRANERLEQRVAERTRELQRSNEDLEQFAYVASHDLQEPLRMVLSYMQLLKQRYAGQLDADAQDFIGFAMDGAQRMQQLISDLLTYSRVGTRQRPMEPVDMEKLLATTLLNLKVAVEETGAVVTHDPLPPAFGDATQISQLLQNLVGNAVKFHREKPPRIHLDASRATPFPGAPPGANGAWEFRVRDEGIGIDREHFERIFMVFQRLHGRGKYAGTGIGLAVCKKIVERHGGRIWLESEPGRGTCFHFTLPGANGSSPAVV